MRTLYFECNMGAAGDMLTAALLELYPEKEAWIEKMNRIGLPDVEITADPSVKCGITGLHVSVKVKGEEEESRDVTARQLYNPAADEGHSHEPAAHSHCQGSRRSQDSRYETDGHEHSQRHSHRGMEEIFCIIDKLKIQEAEKEDIKGIYRLLAEAEGRVHGKPAAKVHFHEVGTMDALADITGCVLLIHALGVEKIIASPVCTGFGQVRCAHGILPVPAPATALLLEGVPVYAGNTEGELCTPTGAALLKYYASSFERMPRMTAEKIGYGMGKKDFPAANCVRAVLGETDGGTEEIIELCCNIDDMTAEEIGFAMELFLDKGALEAFTVPVGMKKSRPGTLLTVMCKKKDRDRLAGLIFRHTSTIGIRENLCGRMVMRRREKIVETNFGPVRIKESSGYGVKKEKPEYEDLKAISVRTGISLRELKNRIKRQLPDETV